MWTMILSFLVKNWKPALYVGAGLALLFAFRLWLNKHDDRIYQQGRQEAIRLVTAEFEKRMAEKEKAVAGERQKLEDERKAVSSERDVLAAKGEELQRLRTVSYGALQKALEISRSYREEIEGQVQAVPADELDDALRNLSVDLAAGQAKPKPPQ